MYRPSFETDGPTKLDGAPPKGLGAAPPLSPVRRSPVPPSIWYMYRSNGPPFETTTYLPSGVNVGDTKTRSVSFVNWRRPVPSPLTIQRLSEPLLSLTKTMVFPS